MREAYVVINGTILSEGQSMTLRVAITDFLSDLSDETFVQELGLIGPAYRARASEIRKLLIVSPKTGEAEK